MEIDVVYGECRCCSIEGHHRDLFKEYYWEGTREVYCEVFIKCYNFRISKNPHLTSLICMDCVKRLQEANSFKNLAINTERQLLQYLATDTGVEAERNTDLDTHTSDILHLKQEPNEKVECWPLEVNDDESLDDQQADVSTEDANDEDYTLSDEDTSEDDTSPEVFTALDTVEKSQIPAKSRKIYEKTYQDFLNWQTSNNLTSFDENVVYTYFEKLANKLKPSSLWTIYSILKCMLAIHHDVDISNYATLLVMLKSKALRSKCRMSKIFTTEEINKFLNEAPDDIYLAKKIILIFGIMGACRRRELYNILFTDVEICGSKIVVNINNVETKSVRTFSLTGRHFELCRKYMALRPKNCTSPGFFISYRSGKCIPQRIGINTLGSVGTIIAKCLNLPDPKSYTGHCFRRTNSALLIGIGGDLSNFMCLNKSEKSTEMHAAQELADMTCVSSNTQVTPNPDISQLELEPRVKVECWPLEPNNDENFDDQDIDTEDTNGDCQLSDDDTSEDDTPADVSTSSDIVDKSQIPEKSRKVYEKAYVDFLDWTQSKNFTSFTENVVFAYFEELANKFKSSSLWSIYSMLKCMLRIHHDVDLSKYTTVFGMLKRKAQGHLGKKSKTFTAEEINKFLNEAPDDVYLSKKVILIFGVMGACRRRELYNILFTDVEIFGSTILVKINKINTKSLRTFSLTGRHYDLCRKYMALRPKNCTTPGFFISDRSGKCVPRRIGINMFAMVGKIIASYLNLQNPKLYTGQCFRRTNAALLRNIGGDLASLLSSSQSEKSIEMPALDFVDMKSVSSNMQDTRTSNMLHSEQQVNVKVECWPLDPMKEDYYDEQDADTEDTNGDGQLSDDDTSDDDKPADGSTSSDIVDKSQIPEKSKKKYEKAYVDFLQWKNSKNFTSFTEIVVFAYFEELAKKFKSSSLWAIYSMLKCMLRIHHDVDMSKYKTVLGMLKRIAQGHLGKKSKTFTSEEINKFLNEAPDYDYLVKKVIFIFGVMGACRRRELYNILFTDVEIFGSTILVKINKINKSLRTFSLTGRHYDLCRKYMALRPKNCTTPGFFISYRSGKCVPQRIGINTFGSVGTIIASYLNLLNPKLYTGHCFRRTNAALLVNIGGDLTNLMHPSQSEISTEMRAQDLVDMTSVSSNWQDAHGLTAMNKTQPDINSVDTSLLDQSTQWRCNESTGILEETESQQFNASHIIDKLALPPKSKRRYVKVYKDFMQWRTSKNLTKISEKDMLTFFQEAAVKSKSSSLWSIFSMLKSTLNINSGEDISKYKKVTAFIKHRAKVETTKKYKTFTPEEIKKFLHEAPDHIYLSKKVMLIFGVIGACRCMELYNIQLTDVEKFGAETILVKISNPESGTTRTFSVTGRYCDMCLRYMKLRPEHSAITAFFVAYRHGKCTAQRIGRNMFGNVGKVIAKYLHLPEPELYVGQCFRRTAATMSIGVDGDFIGFKRHMRLRSSMRSSTTMQDTSVAESQNCVESKRDDVTIEKDEPKKIEVEIGIKIEPWNSDNIENGVCDDQCDEMDASEDTQNISDVVKMKDDPDVDIDDSWLLSQSNELSSDSLGPHLNSTEDTDGHSRRASDTDTSADEASHDPTTSAGSQIPEKSKKKYEKVYKDFMEWRESQKHISFSEDVVFAYFDTLSKKFQSPTLWAMYSMLKCTLSLHHQVELSKYTKVLDMIKSKSVGHTCKKSKTFSADDVKRFLDEAPDDVYLVKKIILIFGIMGACRTMELYNILQTDVEIFGSTVLVKVNNSDTKTSRTFSVTGKYVDLCKKYISLRPLRCGNSGFFLDYRCGKCTTQRVGKNTFGNVGKVIARFLQLPDPEMYTGQCFRKTSETLLVGADGYLDSKRNKRAKNR